MRVLWVTNIPLAGAAALLEGGGSPFGGWLQGSLTALAGHERDVQLVVASPAAGDARSLGSVGGVEYVTFPPVPRRAAKGDGVEVAAALIERAEPDLVHLHGTELPHSLSFAVASDSRGLPSVVSIQGLVGVYARHLDAFLPPMVVHGFGSRPWARSDRVAGLRAGLRRQARLELETLRSTRHVIGRTSWDRACTHDLAPGARYHHVEETLRAPFYEHRWRAQDATPSSILVSQGHYPVKGLHLMLEALPLILVDHPDTVVTVAGRHPLASGRRSPYARHLERLVDLHGLEGHVRFVGEQGPEQMLERYLTSAVAVSPSVIENSPNSVAEAMLLGMPVVASHVGGVPDMVTSGVDGLTYQADAPYMLAAAVRHLFADPATAAALGERAHERAAQRHDPDRNAVRTLQVYRDVIDEEPHP